MKRVIAVLVCGGLGVAFGASVLKVDSKQSRIAISHVEGQRWEVGDTVAVEQAGQKIAWGVVSKVAAKGALANLTHRTKTKVMPGGNVSRSEPPAGEELERLSFRASKPRASGESPRSGSPHAGPPGSIALARPSFRALFDLWLSYRPLHTPELTFENNHSLLMLAIAPDRSTEFVFEVSPNPRFFELDYDPYPGLEIRAGRIWIPFDDDITHKFYGGRPQLTRFLQPQATAFLPELWADMGVGIRASILSTGGAEVSGDLYVVNGFGERSTGDPHPLVASRAQSYPEFGSVLSQDNNDDKALGGRLSMSMRNLLDFGASVYRGKYTNRGQSQAAVTLFGVDGRLRFGAVELKGGNIYGVVDLIGATDSTGKPVLFARRGGYYAEVGVWFGDHSDHSAIRVALRAGQSQNDSRFVATSDQTVVGAIVTSHLGPIVWSVEYSKDIEKRDGKTETDFAALRLSSHF